MLHAVDYRLHDLLGVAGATVIFILVGAVLMGGFNAKYVQLFERYRGLTAEFRQTPADNPRKNGLGEQIVGYRRRIKFINVASVFITLGMLLFLLTVAVASLSVMFPYLLQLRLLGTIGVLGGLALNSVGVALDLVETILSRKVVHEEISDIPDLPRDDGITK